MHVETLLYLIPFKIYLTLFTREILQKNKSNYNDNCSKKTVKKIKSQSSVISAESALRPIQSVSCNIHLFVWVLSVPFAETRNFMDWSKDVSKGLDNFWGIDIFWGFWLKMLVPQEKNVCFGKSAYWYPPNNLLLL